MDLLSGLTWSAYLPAAAAILVGSAVQGSTGLGFGMIAAPILAIIDPAFVPGPALLLATLVSLLLSAREYRKIDRRGVAWALTGRLPASLLAALTVTLLPASTFSIVFASLVLAAIGLSLLGWRLRPTPPNLVAAGAASGYMGTITSVGAPPMAIVYQHATGPEIRSTLGAYFVLGGLLSIGALALVGHFGLDDIRLTLLLLPPLLAGFLLSGLGRRLVDRGRVRVAVLILSAASALILLGREIL
jgi:uncharacterized protein